MEVCGQRHIPAECPPPPGEIIPVPILQAAGLAPKVGNVRMEFEARPFQPLHYSLNRLLYFLAPSINSFFILW